MNKKYLFEKQNWWRKSATVVKPQSHSGDFWRRTNTNRHSLRFAHHRIGSNYFLLVRCHFRIRSATTAGQYDCFEHVQNNRRGPANWSLFVLHRWTSCQFLLVCISSLSIPISSLWIRTSPCCLPGAIQYDAIRCATMTYEPTRIDTV